MGRTKTRKDIKSAQIARKRATDQKREHLEKYYRRYMLSCHIDRDSDIIGEVEALRAGCGMSGNKAIKALIRRARKEEAPQ